MPLTDFPRLLRRQVILIIAATLIGVAMGATVALTTPPRYDAKTEVLLSVQVSPDARPGERTAAGNYITQVAATYQQLVTSWLVLSPVIEDLRLDRTPAQLAEAVRASASPRGAIITIVVSHQNPGQAARIANAIADSFAEVVVNTLEAREIETAYAVRALQIEQALVPTVPAAPNMRLSLLLGALLGLGGGVGIAVLRASLDTRIRTASDLEQAVSAPVLASTLLDPQTRTRPLVVASAPQHPAAEAYRTLRTNVRFLFPEQGPANFVVTSATPGEGKSTTTANLAIAFAEAGYRVALIDADLRLPRVAETFGIEGAIGLSDVLAGRIGAEDVLQRWGRDSLFLLPAGTIPPNPAELLGSTAMTALLADLAQAVDVILIDSPPLLAVTDAAVIARVATGALLVAAAGDGSKPQVADAAARLRTADARVLGAVLTMAPTRGADKTAYASYAYART